MATTTTTLTPEPQVCMGGVINPKGWNVGDDAGNYYGYIFKASEEYGGRYWVEAAGMRRRGYASLDNAVAAIQRAKAS